MVTVFRVWVWNGVVLDGISVVGCESGTNYVGWKLCCRVWVWNGLCWMITLL
jgi:hypothetical protein